MQVRLGYYVRVAPGEPENGLHSHPTQVISKLA